MTIFTKSSLIDFWNDPKNVWVMLFYSGYIHWKQKFPCPSPNYSKSSCQVLVYRQSMHTIKEIYYFRMNQNIQKESIKKSFCCWNSFKYWQINKSILNIPYHIRNKCSWHLKFWNNFKAMKYCNLISEVKVLPANYISFFTLSFLFK